jgi:hypothetical protein
MPITSWPLPPYSVLMLKLMGESFIAYETKTFPLAFPTGKSTNKSLQRELCHVEVQCLIMFFFFFLVFLDQHLVLLNWNWAHSGGNFKEDQYIMHKRLAVIWCHWKMWRRWTINNATEQEPRLSLADDWRCCCRCSWLKRRGATSMGLDKQCSHRRLCRHSLSIWCSTLVRVDLNLATSPLMLSTSF